MFRNQTFSVFRFLLVFAFLSFFFYAYIGIISPGGKGYSRFLDQYADFPAWFSYVICGGAKGTLQLLGFDVYQKSLNNVTIRGGRGINIIWACLGFKVMSFWAAFVIAHKANIKYKLTWIAIGISTITVINIIRMDLIALGLHYDWKTFNALDIHSSFTIVSYIAIFGLMWWFIRNYKTRTAKSELPQVTHKTFPTISAQDNVNK